MASTMDLLLRDLAYTVGSETPASAAMALIDVTAYPSCMKSFRAARAIFIRVASASERW